jgi:hypothetical protein
MKMIRMCLNWKVIAGLTAAGLGLWLVAPNLLAAAVPILLLAVCPLSMLLMMRAMGRSSDTTRQQVSGDGRLLPPGDVRLERLRAQRALLDEEIAALENGRPEHITSN